MSFNPKTSFVVVEGERMKKGSLRCQLYLDKKSPPLFGSGGGEGCSEVGIVSFSLES
jgi:hypothetical protein